MTPTTPNNKEATNGSDGGNGGSFFAFAKGDMKLGGKIITNGGDAAPGGKPGNAGSVGFFLSLQLQEIQQLKREGADLTRQARTNLG